MFDIYTDGACAGNPGPGGWAYSVVKKSDDSRIYSLSGSKAETTNNRMELTAAIAAFHHIISHTSADPNVTPNHFTIVTDSKYVQDGLTTWLPNWKKRNWITSTRKPVKNKDLWLEIDALKDKVPGVTLRWVKGHSGDSHNDHVDALAVQAIPGGLPQSGPRS